MKKSKYLDGLRKCAADGLTCREAATSVGCSYDNAYLLAKRHGLSFAAGRDVNDGAVIARRHAVKGFREHGAGGQKLAVVWPDSLYLQVKRIADKRQISLASAFREVVTKGLAA